MFQREFKIKIIDKWVQIISPCRQWLAKCCVIIQRCSAAPAPKLFGTEKLLLCYRLTPRRSSFPDWQRVGVPTCSLGLRFRPRWAQRGIRFQCWSIFPLCEKRRVPLQHLPRGRTPVTYDSARGHMTVTSQHKDLPLCHGTSVRPSGLFPSVRNNPVGSFVTGAEAKHRATKSLRA